MLVIESGKRVDCSLCPRLVMRGHIARAGSERFNKVEDQINIDGTLGGCPIVAQGDSLRVNHTMRYAHEKR